MNRKSIIVLLILFSINCFGQQLEVFFDFNKSEINEGSKQKIMSWISMSKDMEVYKIYGFCDWKGTNVYNDTLSLKRVNEVYDFLIKNKITVLKNFEIQGFGEDFKQSKIQSENRKVIIFFQKKKINKPVLEQDRTLDEKLKSGKVGDVIVLEKIYFKNRSSRIVPESVVTLYELLCSMEENPNLKIEIQGHICCQPGGDLENISTMRARAIYVFLLRNRIDRKRLSYKGYGISSPIHPIPEKSEKEENENRRVEIKILEN